MVLSRYSLIVFLVSLNRQLVVDLQHLISGHISDVEVKLHRRLVGSESKGVNKSLRREYNLKKQINQSKLVKGHKIFYYATVV